MLKGKNFLTLFLISFIAWDGQSTDKRKYLKQAEFNKLPIYYTGKVFPTPQKAKYSDRFFSLNSTAAILGKELGKNDLKVKLLCDRIKLKGGNIEVVNNDSKIEKYDTVIYLNDKSRGKLPPEKPQAYSISCATKNGKNIVTINSKDPQGLLWGIASLTQLIKTENKVPFLRCVEISDFPDNEIRGILSLYKPKLAPELLFFSKMNSIVFQYALSKERNYSFRNKDWLDTERVNSMRFYGAIGKELNLNIYYSIGARSFFIPEEKNGIPLRCSSEEDYKIVYDITCLLAKNHCGLYLSFDDYRFSGFHGTESRTTPIPPTDLKKFGSAREADIYFANKLYKEVKEKYPDFKMVFCPPFYWGPASPTPYPENREEYLKALGERLDKNIDIFWTGPRVAFSPTSKKEVEWITSLIKRKPVYFANGIGSKHVDKSWSYITDPITIWKNHTYDGFFKDVTFIFNTCCGTVNATSTATLGDYLWNEKAYNPEKSIKTTVKMFFGPNAFPVLDDLNKKLSYFDVYGLRISPAAAMRINELEAKFKDAENAYLTAEKYNKFALENLSGMKRYLELTKKFINKLKKNPKLKTFAKANEIVETDATKETNFKKEDILLTPNDFIGGRGPSIYATRCPPRLSSWIYGKKTANSSMIADFECKPFPPSGDYKLIISGQDDDASKECNIEIKLNDKSLFIGPSGFVKNGWSLREFHIPAICLKRRNKLKIINIEDSSIATGPPFFMLNYAVLRKNSK